MSALKESLSQLVRENPEVQRLLEEYGHMETVYQQSMSALGLVEGKDQPAADSSRIVISIQQPSYTKRD